MCCVMFYVLPLWCCCKSLLCYLSTDPEALLGKKQKLSSSCNGSWFLFIASHIVSKKKKKKKERILIEYFDFVFSIVSFFPTQKTNTKKLNQTITSTLWF